VIFVVKDSTIVERGTHDALMAAGGAYRDLYELQAGGRTQGKAGPVGV